tara:strand:- start:12415 stop:12615 length:201 start_codon:yes stop_codon:yes gene_type:complete
MRPGDIININSIPVIEVVRELNSKPVGHCIDFCVTRTKNGGQTKMFGVEKIDNQFVKLMRTYTKDI